MGNHSILCFTKLYYSNSMDAIVFKKSQNFKSEYSAKIIRIPAITHIEGTDKLGICYINGYPIIVDDTSTKEGDIMVYCCNETKLNSGFLASNNQFRNAESNLDPNARCGYFDDKCRVKNIKLKGTYSWGILFELSAFEKWLGMEIKELDALIDVEFDAVDAVRNTMATEILFCEAYIPEITAASGSHRGGGKNKSQNRVDKFDRLEPGQFKLHYDTTPIANTHGIFDKDTSIAISVKVHGASGIFANVITRDPIKRNKIGRWFVNTYNWIAKKINISEIPIYTKRYGNVYSSKKVVKNKEINLDQNGGFYNTDIWGCVNDIISPWIPKGVTVYGEIVGYTDNGKNIQKGYDYGCKMNDDNKPMFKFMPYRITETDENGNITKEHDMDSVVEFTDNLIALLPDEQKKYVEKIPMLYNGTVKQLLNLPDDCKMDRFEISDKLVMSLKKMFGMECNEPLCVNSVPREGIVVRINNDEFPRAFKLKAEKFLVKESKAMDAGEVDMEMKENS